MLELESITGQIIGSGMKVHSALGPDLLESAYEACLLFELRRSGLRVAAQVSLPVIYDEVRLDVGYRLDLVVEDAVTSRSG